MQMFWCRGIGYFLECPYPMLKYLRPMTLPLPIQFPDNMPRRPQITAQEFKSPPLMWWPHIKFLAFIWPSLAVVSI